MPKRLQLKAHLTVEELEARYRKAKDPVERSHYQIIWQLALGQPSEAVAAASGYTLYWVRALARRYNARGPAGLADRRHAHPGGRRLLSAEREAELGQALQGAPPDGGLWSGPKVAQWMSAELGRAVHKQRGWEALRRLGYTPQVPRPRHAKADAAAQAAFKKTSPPR